MCQTHNSTHMHGIYLSIRLNVFASKILDLWFASLCYQNTSGGIFVQLFLSQIVSLVIGRAIYTFSNFATRNADHFGCAKVTLMKVNKSENDNGI